MTEEQTPSEQRGGTTPDEAEAREKGEWAGTSGDGVVPAGARRLRRAARDARRGSGARELACSAARPAPTSRRPRAASTSARATRPTRRPTAGSEPPGRGARHARTSAPRPASPTPTTLPSRAFAEAAARDGIALEPPGVRLALRAGPRRPRARRQGAPRPGHRRAGASRRSRCSPRSTRGSRATSPCCTPRARTCSCRSTSSTRRPARVIAVDGREHFTSFRLTALELYPPDAALGFDLEEHRELCRALSRRDRRDSTAASPRRASASAACRASAPTTTRCSTSRSRRWATRRSCGSRRRRRRRGRLPRHRAALLRSPAPYRVSAWACVGRRRRPRR